MTPEIFFLCIFAALLELDTTYAFQLTFSRGIIAAPLLALLTGDVMAGIQVGVFTELLFADISPLGGILPPSAVICSAVSLALHALGIDLYLAFFFGVICAITFSFAEKYIRKNRCKWHVFLEQRMLQHPNKINCTVAVSLFTSFLMNFVLLFTFTYLCARLMTWLLPLIPLKAHIACKFAYMAVPWIGLATLVPTFRLKTR